MEEAAFKARIGHWIGAVLGAGAAAATIATFFGIEFGKRQAEQSVNVFFTQVLQGLPADQRTRAAPAIETIREGAQRSVRSGEAADGEASARAIESLVKSEPLEHYIVTSDPFSLAINQTGMVCPTRTTVTYNGLGAATDSHAFHVGGRLFLARVGQNIQHQNVTLYFLTMRDDRPVLHAICR